jgi:hypothetical protein
VAERLQDEALSQRLASHPIDSSKPTALAALDTLEYS